MDKDSLAEFLMELRSVSGQALLRSADFLWESVKHI